MQIDSGCRHSGDKSTTIAALHSKAKFKILRQEEKGIPFYEKMSYNKQNIPI